MSADSEQPRDALASLRIARRDERPKRRGGLKWLLVLAILLAVAVGGYFAAERAGLIGGVAEFVPEAIRSLPEVRVARVAVERGRSADAIVVATGYVESRRQAKIGARAAGRIEIVNVEEGTRVETGQVIAVLEHKDMDAALAATKATLARAKAELGEQEVEIARVKSLLERAESLMETDSITMEDFEQAQFQHDAAVARRDSLKAAVALAEARVTESEQFKENMIVRAPFDGTVISKDAEVGESILPGGMGEASGRGSVVTIADLDHLEVDCDVKEDYISRVEQDAPTEVAVDAVPDRRYKGRVRKIIPMGDRARATIKVKVEILDADKRLFPDMSATVYFLAVNGEQVTGENEERVFCDSDAVQSDGDSFYVWLLDDERRAQRVDVTVGAQRDRRAEITSGLTGGERLIVKPPDEIVPGMLLRIRE